MEGYVKVIISRDGDDWQCEKSYISSTTIKELKKRLVLLVGFEAEDMGLSFFDKDDHPVEMVTCREDATLGELGICSGMRIQVKDNSRNVTDGHRNEEEEMEKFVLRDEAYEKRSDSALAFLKEHHFGRFDIEGKNVIKCRALDVGKRCVVKMADGEKPGTILFVGKTHLADNKYLVGVEYDEPIGKHNGTVDGHVYFHCKDNHGALVRPTKVWLEDPNPPSPPVPQEDEQVNPEDII